MNTRALVLCGDTWHPTDTVRSGLAALNDCGFHFEFLDDSTAWSATRMNEFPLTILAKANITSADMERPWLAGDAQHAFPEYVRRGHGLVVVHAGTSRYEKLPAMLNLMGGAFVSHPNACAVTVEPKPGHRLTAGIAPFTVRDEHYLMALDDAQADIFLHSRSCYGVQPAGWTRTDGAGRVCVLTPGHDLEVWQHPSFRKLLLNAFGWTAKLN
jgi:type 1 glutamine amidotransferase